MSERKVVSGFFWVFGERITAQFVSFVVSVVLARILLPSEYGVIALIIVFINIANVFVVSGLSTSLIQKKDANEEDFSTIFYCSLILSVLIYILLWFAAPFIADFYNSPHLTAYVRVFSIKILVSSYNSIQHAYVSRHMIFKKFFIATLFGTIISAFVGIGMAYMGFGAWSIIGQYLTNTVIDTLVLAVILPWRPRRMFNWKSAKSLISYGWKVLATDLLGTVFVNLRSLLLGKVYTTADLAYYNKGQQFPQLIGNNLDATITTVLFPAMSNKNDSTVEVRILTRRAIRIASYLIYPILGGLIAVAQPLVVVLLTEKWKPCIFFFQMLCISQGLTTVSNLNLQALKAIGRSDVTLKLEFVKKPVYLLFLVAGMYYSTYAVVISMVLYSFVGTTINILPNAKHLSYTFKEQLIDILPAVLVSAAVVAAALPLTLLPLNNYLILAMQIVVGAGVYVALSILFKVDSFFYLIGVARSFLKVKSKKQTEQTKHETKEAVGIED